MTTPQPAPEHAGVYGHVDSAISGAERGAFGLFGHFIPDSSVLRQFQFQHLIVAKFLADAARDGIKYAAIVTVVQNGGSAFESSIVGLASIIPGIFFSLWGGAIADSMPKRLAIGGAYLTDAALCIIIPVLFGTETLLPMFLLTFGVSTLTQVASPAESTVVPMVSSNEQLASATSLMGVSSSFGTAVGTAFVAPILLLAFGPEAVFATCAVMLVLASTRILHVSSSQDVQKAAFKRPKANFRKVLAWLFQNPSIATMVGVSVIVGVAYQIMTTLAPNYVAEVLNVDPAKTVYVMGVAGCGMTLSLAINPFFVNRFGERKVAGVGFVLAAVSMVGLGLVDEDIVKYVDPFNPLHWLSFIGIDLDPLIRTAAFFAFPLGIGAGVTDNAVKTYLNRRVPLTYQGRTFSIKGLLESGITVIPLLTASALATVYSVSAVLIFSPLIFYSSALLLVRLSAAVGGEDPGKGTGVLKTYWDDPEADISEMAPDDDEAAGAPAEPAGTPAP